MTHISYNSQDRRQKITTGWMITLASFFTALLAFFVFFASATEKGITSPFKVADNLNKLVYKQILLKKAEMGLTWLSVENTVTKGVKVLIPEKVKSAPMFPGTRCEINDEFLPYVDSIIGILNSLDLDSLVYEESGINKEMKKNNQKVIVDITIEGHTDKRRITSPFFKDNWDLSLARADNVMKYILGNSDLPARLFSICGYGAFHPRNDKDRFDENRRIEIYINFQQVNLNAI